MNSSSKTPFRKAARILSIFFIMVNALVIVFRPRLEDRNVDIDVVIVGNLVLFIVSLLATWMYGNAAKQSKGHGVVRNIYGGFMLKFFALLVTAMIYFYFAKEINKPAIFICLGLYLVYTFAGVAQISKRSAQPDTHKSHHHEAHHTHHHK